MAHSVNRSSLVGRLFLGKSAIFKIFLLAGVITISVVFIWYTFAVIEQLKIGTRSQVEKYVAMWQIAADSPTSGRELQFIFDEIIVKADFPIIVLDENYEPIHWRNIDGVSSADFSEKTKARLRREAREMIKQNGEIPLHFAEKHVSYFCYGDSRAIRQLIMMPFIEIGIVVAFLLMALIGFQNIRRSEERHIWVGMAKETAHQLGTPISSLMGWVEIMTGEAELAEISTEDKEQFNEALSNMRVDIDRLHRVANRFGQIGSVPDLHECDINQVIRETVEYYRRRLPFEGKGININFSGEKLPVLQLNSQLFSWALENLLKNSMQAVDSRDGRIDIKTVMHSSTKSVIIEIADNGPGIPPGAVRKVFRAGFTTKKRGWGLGLTLVKRIVEEYHNGRITLKKTHPGQTIFEIQLPVLPSKG